MTDVRRADELWDARAESAAADGMLAATIRECLARYMRRARRRQRRGHSDTK